MDKSQKIKVESKIDFECHDHPGGSYKKIIKRSNESPFEESVCKDAVETSVSILRAIAAMRLAEQKIQQETS